MPLAFNFRNGVAALLLGLAVSASLYLWLALMNAVPLDIAVPLSLGHIQTPEFTTKVTIPYDIDIAFDSTKIPYEKLNCLIGMNLDSVQPCTDEPSILNVKWKVVSDGQTLANGSSTDTVRAGYSYHKTARYMGRFDAKSGKKYRLEIDVLQDATRLALANPRLGIEPFLNAYDGRLLLAGPAFYVGLFGAAIGIITMVTSTIREMRLRKTLARS